MSHIDLYAMPLIQGICGFAFCYLVLSYYENQRSSGQDATESQLHRIITTRRSVSFFVAIVVALLSLCCRY
jgi:H+/Cl- antiporter ClcA